MNYTFPVFLILLGALAVPNMVIAKKPELKPTLDKITPYQGWLGAIGALWGLWGVITFVLNMSAFLHTKIFFLVMFLASVVTLLGLGILLGTGTMKQFVKDENAKKKMDETVAKLQPFQGKLGLAGMVVGVLGLVANFI